MPLTISFELSDKDLRYFRERVKEAKAGATRAPEAIVAAARHLLEQTRKIELPDFVRVRIEKLEQLSAMLEDVEWKLEGSDRQRVINAMAYFAEVEDVIPDTIPGLGYLDDAIMVELACQELQHEIAAYADFCDYRLELTKGRGKLPALSREEWITRKRVQLQDRMRRRRGRVWGSRLGRPLW